MSTKTHWVLTAGTVVAAALLWFLTFYFEQGNFWVKITLSSLALAGAALGLSGKNRTWNIYAKDIAIGAGGAVVLYMIFYIGNEVSNVLFDFASAQVRSIYTRDAETPTWLIGVLLFFITSPAEEIYWRGFLQEKMTKTTGTLLGWLTVTLLYTLVHLPAWNLMLIGAAAVAGAFWGGLYWYLRRLAPLIACHAIWSVSIFVLFPIR